MIYGSVFSNPKNINKQSCARRTATIKEIDGPNDLWVRHSRDYKELMLNLRTNAVLWSGVAQAYERLEDYGKATAACRHGFELNPTDTDLAFDWLRNCLKNGDYDQAKVAQNELATLDPLRAKSPFVTRHPTILRGKAAEVATAIEKASRAEEAGKQGTKFLGRPENKNTVPRQDPDVCAAYEFTPGNSSLPLGI